MLDASAKQGILKPIRLVIVDRQPIVLHGLKSVLGAQQDFDVVASSSDGTTCLEAIRNLSPDVALIADALPDLTASEILAVATAEKLSTRLVFFTESDTDRGLTAAIAAGACSAISKYAAPAAMLQSLRLMTKSGVSLQQRDLSPLDQQDDGGKIKKMLQQLTDRERQIARLVSEGMSNKEIARELKVSQGTVKVHLHNIFHKLEITNRTVLATIALLQRTSGFGALALAFLAFAIADELKAAETNDVAPDDDSIGPADDHAAYAVWKKAILQRLIASDSGETPAFTERELFVRASQNANPPAAMEALRAAEQFPGVKPWKEYGAFGSSTPNLPALLLPGTNDIASGGDRAGKHHLPQPASNWVSIDGGYGTLAAIAGALIYALSDSEAAAQPHHPGQASIDSVLASVGGNVSAKLAAIAHVDVPHAEDSLQSFLSHDFHSPFATIGNDNVPREADARGQMAAGAAGDSLAKLPGILDSGDGAGLGGHNGDQLVGRGLDNLVDRASLDSRSGSPDSGFEFGPARLNLAAFGALAWLHLTAATKSVPPHTLAWFYDPASNQTVVYVNPTDRALHVGDGGLLEIHLQGIVAIAETEGVTPPHGATVAVTLEQLEQALTSPTATDETASSADSSHASEQALGTAGVWSALADNGLSFQFAQGGTGSGTSTKFRTVTSDSEDNADESGGSSLVSAHGSSAAPGYTPMTPAVESPATKGASAGVDTGAAPTKQNEVVFQSGPLIADGAGPGQSDHASEPGSGKPTGAETAEANSKPGNGNDEEHHAEASKDSPGTAKAAEPDGAAHGKSGHSASAKAPAVTEDAQPSSATTEAATSEKNGHGNSHHEADPGAAKLAAAELPGTQSKHGNGVGNANEHQSQASDAAHASPAPETAELAVVEHGKSGHDATHHDAGGGNAKGAQGDAPASGAVQPVKVTSKSGGADQDAVFRFDSGPAPFAHGKDEHKDVHDPHVAPGREENLQMIADMVPAPDQHVAHHDSNGPHPDIVPAPHHWLI